MLGSNHFLFGGVAYISWKPLKILIDNRVDRSVNCVFKDHPEPQFPHTWFWVYLVNKDVVITAPAWFHTWLLLSKKPKEQNQSLLRLGICYVLNSGPAALI